MTSSDVDLEQLLGLPTCTESTTPSTTSVQRTTAGAQAPVHITAASEGSYVGHSRLHPSPASAHGAGPSGLGLLPPITMHSLVQGTHSDAPLQTGPSSGNVSSSPPAPKSTVSI